MLPSTSPDQTLAMHDTHTGAARPAQRERAYDQVAACDPEVPPLEMMSGTKRARTNRPLISFSIEGHGRCRQHLA
jgi:hypothetical protein